MKKSKKQKDLEKEFKKFEKQLSKTQKTRKIDWIERVSIDMISIVGNFANADDFERFMGAFGKGGMSITKWFSEGSDASGMFFDKVHWSLIRWKNAREFRLEFNPNKLNEEQTKFIAEEVIGRLKNVSVTRLDIAFDCDKNLLEYHFFDKYGKKLQMWFGRDRSLETMYLGSKGSDEQIRVYNKYREQKDKIAKNYRARYSIREHHKQKLHYKFLKKTGISREDTVYKEAWENYFNSFRDKLTKRRDREIERAAEKMMNEEGLKKHWVRYEIQWRREEKPLMLKSQTKELPFDNIKIIKYGLEQIEDWEMQAKLEFLMKSPENWNKIKDARTRKKYKDVLMECITEDVAPAFNNEFKQKKSDLRHQVVNLLKHSHDWDVMQKII